jgi:transformation/transcription domain-associated protein
VSGPSEFQTTRHSTIDPNADLSEDPTMAEIDSEKVIAVVNKAVQSIMTRLNNLSHFEISETNQMNTLVQTATNPDNLCRMDPTFHPWL